MSHTDWPRCSHPLKDGTPCSRAVAPGEDGKPSAACAHHLKASAAAGLPSSSSPVVVEEQPAAATPDPAASSPASEFDTVVAAGNPGPEREPQAITSLRQALRGDLQTDTVAALISDLLLDALRASRDIYSTCPKCETRHAVNLPDLAARVKAAESLMEQVEGRLAQAAKSDETGLAAILERTLFESLSDAQLGLYLAAYGEEHEARHAQLRELAERVLAEPVDPYEQRDRRRYEIEAMQTTTQ